MKALGVALAVCCAVVLWPSAARANPIGAQVGAVTCALGAQSGSSGGGDATFTSESGMDQSLQFANTGLVAVFNDERTALADLIAVEGLGADLHKELTLALRTHDKAHHANNGHRHDNDNDNDNDADDSAATSDPAGPASPTANAPHLADPLPQTPQATDPPADPPTSATPEPGAFVLLATGLVGLVCLRRQISA
jgi:hypothetical protein